MKEYLKQNWMLLVALALVIGALIAIDYHVYTVTRGCYTLLEIMRT